MPSENPDPETYLNKLEHLKTVFPVPVSSPIMDGYFVHTVSRFLDLVDNLKSSAPAGQDSASIMKAAGGRLSGGHGFGGRSHPDLADYCHGMTVWAHPHAQVNVIPPTSIPGLLAFVVAAM